jgi:hypothetical protein
LPAYIELLIAKRDGLIDDNEFERHKSVFLGNDLREDVSRLLHRKELRDQYTLSLRGAGHANWYGITLGYDEVEGTRVGDRNGRMTLQMQNGIRLGRTTEISGQINFAKLNKTTNSTSSYSQGEIYESLLDGDGNVNAIGGNFRIPYRQRATETGLLDWMQRPLEEPYLNDNQVNQHELRLQTGVRQMLTGAWHLSLAHQYVYGQQTAHTLNGKNSFYARNMVNRFTQQNGTKVIPEGGIMEYMAPLTTDAHTFRAQTDFARDFENWGRLDLLAGSEIRHHQVRKCTNVVLYGFDEDSGKMGTVTDFETRHPTRPTGTSRIANAHDWTNLTVGRYLSYFANMGYEFQKRYLLSGSVRWDGSNLLGVETNKRGTVLYSIGVAYNAHREQEIATVFDQLKFRLTYGSAGNIDRSQSHYPTIALSTNSETGLTTALVTHPGNPDLKWEQVKTLNGGIDFRFKSFGLHGTLDVYDKNANDLLGITMMDPTTGVVIGSNYKMNYASLNTKGIDLQVGHNASIGNGLSWNNTVLLSISKNKVTKYNAPELDYAAYHITQRLPRLNESMDMLYAYRWFGLSPETGLPIAYSGGELIEEPGRFTNYYLQIPVEDLLRVGSSVPTFFGSYRTGLAWRGISISALFSFKSGYVFRRSSIATGQEFLDLPVYHLDYLKRWQKPGDELITNVPAHADRILNTEQNAYYRDSEVLIEPGDNIRLQDINLSYDLPVRFAHNVRLQGIKCYLYARNLGVVWKKSKLEIDPDYHNLDYPPSLAISFGLQASF